MFLSEGMHFAVYLRVVHVPSLHAALTKFLSMRILRLQSN